MIPSRRTLAFTTLSAPTILIAGALLQAGCSHSDAAPRPDIVIYLCDTLRPDHLGLYGYERNTSPHIDLLAEDAIVFERALAPSSWTKASTASLLTGLDPLLHNATGRDTRLPDSVQLLSETLKELGYYNAGIVTNPFVSELFGFEQGYDEFRFLGRAKAELLMDRVEEVLDNRPKDKPFFLYVHSIDPHAPYDAPPPFPRAFSKNPKIGNPDELKPTASPAELRVVRNSYDSEILYHDKQFNRLIDRMRTEGLYEDCMFWFVSDHGDEFLEHGRAGHGRQLFDESIRIPMIFKLPGNQHAGTRVSARASLIDVVPTVLGYLGQFPPKDSEGIDLLADLTGRDSRPPLFLDLDLMVEELFVANGVQRGKYKYIRESLPEQRRFLYDLDADPDEKVNLINEQPEIAAELETLVRIHSRGRRSGITLSFVGKGSQKVRARFRTDGKFIGVEMIELEDGDLAEISEDGQTLNVTLALEEFLSNIGQLPTSDIDSLTLRLDPQEAAVTVEVLELVGSDNEYPLFLGLDRELADIPHTLHAADPILLTSDLGLLFREERGGAGSNVRGDARSVPQPDAGLYAVALEGVSAEDIESLPDDVRAQLEELGYMGH